MNIPSTYTTNVNFWDIHQQFSAVGIFKRLHDSDKSRGKGTSSNLMWSIVLIWDRYSMYYKLPEDPEDPDSKITLIFTDVYGDKHYYQKNEPYVTSLKNLYLKMQETSAMRNLRELEEKLEQRATFIHDTYYDIGVVNEKGAWVGGTAALIDKMIIDTKKVYDVQEQLIAMVAAEEEESGVNKGGGMSSLSDTKQI